MSYLVIVNAIAYLVMYDLVESETTTFLRGKVTHANGETKPLKGYSRQFTEEIVEVDVVNVGSVPSYLNNFLDCTVRKL